MNRMTQWFKIDNAGKLFPIVQGKLRASYFRLSVILKETIDPVALQLAAEKNCFFCFFPNANLYIENKLPNYNLFIDHISQLCIGTDSLASNGCLDLISEANVILSHSKNYKKEYVHFVVF
jgi:hypothetical protein